MENKIEKKTISPEIEKAITIERGEKAAELSGERSLKTDELSGERSLKTEELLAERTLKAKQLTEKDLLIAEKNKKIDKLRHLGFFARLFSYKKYF